MNPNSTSSSSSINGLLTAGTGVTLLALIVCWFTYPELVWLNIILAALSLSGLGGLMYQNQKSLRTRSAAYGLNSAVTVILVFCILGVVNFLGSRYPLKKDLTQNKAHTLSDQSIKVTKSLTTPLKATFFAKLQQKEQFRPLLDNYKALSPKFEIEYVDPDREPTRTNLAGVKSYGTLVLSYGPRQSKIENVSEEKITNAMIKIIKEKSPTLCAITGHGEKSFDSGEANGYQTAKKALQEQSYVIKDVNIIQETKIPESCDAVAVIGPTKSFLEPEAKALRDYLADGGRGVFAVDINIKGPDYSPEIVSILESWYVKPMQAFVVDPLSRMFGVDASVAIIATFNRAQAITKDFQANCVFPFTRPLELLPNPPSSLNVQYLAQTTPKSWAVTDFSQLAKGKVDLHEGKDKLGPLNAAVVVDGKQKDSKAAKNTRLVVFGSSYFADNQVSRNAGNLDFFLNSVSWVMEDESLISIRAKEEVPGKVELSEKSASLIKLLTIFILPLMVAVTGVLIWVRRRKL